MRRKLVTLLICALVMPVSAMAQARQFPDNAKRGSIVHIQEAAVAIDGQTMRLSASAQTRNQDNLIIMPVNLPPGALVKYTLDGTGQIHRVWMLTAEEAAVPDKKPQ